MNRRESEWQRPKSQGMLHQHQQDVHDQNYRANHLRVNSEAFIRQNFINRPFKAKVFHSADADLRDKQQRNILLSLLVNLHLMLVHNFNICSRALAVCFAFLLPAREARSLAALATVALMAGIAFAAYKEVPLAFSAASHTLHSKALMHEMHELRALI